MPFDSLEVRVRLEPWFRLTHCPEVPAASRTTGATTNLEVLHIQLLVCVSYVFDALLGVFLVSCLGHLRSSQVYLSALTAR